MSPLNFYCILLQVFDTSPKLNVSHSTETNSSWRGAILLSVAQKQLLVGCREQLEINDS